MIDEPSYRSRSVISRRTTMPCLLPNAILVAHIVDQHHAYARRALPYIVPLLAKVVGAHGKRNPKLSALCDAGQELADALEAHLDDEERDLFPALLAGAPPRDVARKLDAMCRHHQEVSLLLARIRWLADGYATPDWCGQSYRALMEELESLDEDVIEHMHLEKYALVSRFSWPRSEAA